jgi:hypothetical protein
MRERVRRRAFVVGFAALGSVWVAAQVGQQLQPQSPPVKGAGLLVGQIVDAASMKGIPAAIVTLSGGPAATSPSTIVLPTGEMVLGGSDQNQPKQVIADSSGRFVFRDLNAGTYQLRATSPGYLPGQFGQNRPSGASQPVTLERDDEKRGGLALRLWQSASVSGRLVDEYNEPVVGISVRLLRRTIVNTRPRFTVGTTGSTDDRGIYRFPGLTPGDYVVALVSTATTLPVSFSDTYMQASYAGNTTEFINEVSISGAPFPFGSGFRVGDLVFQTDGGGRSGGSAIPAPGEDGRLMLYPPQFYPSAGVITQATVITLQSGDERTDVDMQLKLRRTQRVSGTVSGPDGPMKYIGVRLMPAGAEELGLGGSTFLAMDAGSTATDASGNFTFLGIPPGAYSVQVVRVPRTIAPRSAMTTTTIEMAGGGMMMSSSGTSTPMAPLALPTDPTLWGGATVNVGETDVHNVAVVLRTGARLSGKIVFEGNGTPPPPDTLQRAVISITSLTGSSPSPVAGAQKRVETDGRFATVGYPPGRYSLAASIPSMPQAKGATLWRFRSATLAGRSIDDEGLEIQNEDIAGLVLTFTDKTTEVSGTVVDIRNQPDPGALVVVLPADTQAWRQSVVTPRRVRSVRTGAGGTFLFRDLPPGEYFLGAVSDAAVSNWSDTRTLDAISRVSIRISVTDGSTTTQRLTTATIR